MGCGCLMLILGMTFPRVTIALLWFFSHWLHRAYDGWLIPALGFVFLPYTLLWYSVVANVFGGRWGLWQVLFMIVALALDLSPSLGRRVRRRRDD